MSTAVQAAAVGGGIKAGGTLFGSIASGIQAKKAQERAQEFNADEANKTRLWQRAMRQTAYQDSTQDMLKAGLNPAMMYGGAGSPSQAPSGPSASVSPVKGNTGEILAGLGDAVGTAVQVRMSRKQQEKMDSEIHVNDQKVQNLIQDIKESAQRINLSKTQQSKLYKDMKMIDAQINKIREDSTYQRLQGQLTIKQQEKLDYENRKLKAELRYIERAKKVAENFAEIDEVSNRLYKALDQFSRAFGIITGAVKQTTD